MLGKASEIKTAYLEGFEYGFHVVDCGLPDDAIILDIKFSTCFEQGYGTRQSALIIYKDGSA